MRTEADVEFFDDELEARVHAAFDATGPSDEARGRMLANLLAYEAQNARSAAQNTQPVAPIAVQPMQEPEPGTQDAAGSNKNAVPDTQPSGMSTEAAQIVAAARSAAPKPKRVIRPWQVLVPVAAVLVLGGVIVASGPLLGQFSLSGATQTASETAGAASTQATKDEAVDAAAPEAEFVEEGAGDAGLDAANSQDQDLEALAEAAVESEDVAAADATSGDTSEEYWARDFPTVVLNSGEEIHIVGGASPAAVSESAVGDYVDEAVAYNADETASVACTVYESRDSAYKFVVSYLGDEIYYPAN